MSEEMNDDDGKMLSVRSGFKQFNAMHMTYEDPCH